MSPQTHSRSSHLRCVQSWAHLSCQRNLKGPVICKVTNVSRVTWSGLFKCWEVSVCDKGGPKDEGKALP